MGDWAIANYKTFEGIDEDKIIASTFIDDGGNGPKSWRIGAYEVSKCWDIAIQQLSVGQIVKLFCPHSLDNGGSQNNYNMNGSGWVKEGTDLSYEIQVLSCDSNPDFNAGDDALKLQ